MKPNSHRRGGFAMILAIVILGMVAMSAAALAISLAGQSRRTMVQSEDAQLRQLLLAAAATAQSPGPISPGSISIALPPRLVEQGAKLTLEFLPAESADTRTAKIQARLPGRQASQRVELTADHGQWRIVRADLGR